MFTNRLLKNFFHLSLQRCSAIISLKNLFYQLLSHILFLIKTQLYSHDQYRIPICRFFKKQHFFRNGWLTHREYYRSIFIYEIV